MQLLNLLGCKVCIGQRGTVVALIPFVSLVTFGARLSLIAAFTFLARGAGVTFLSLFTLERRKLLRREVVESEWVAFLSALALFALLSRLSRVALDVRKHGLDFNVGGIIPASRHKLDVKRLRRVKVTHTVGIDTVGEHHVHLRVQHADTQARRVDHDMYFAVVVEAVHALPAYTRHHVGVGLVGGVEPRHEVVVGERDFFASGVFETQEEIEVGFIIDFLHIVGCWLPILIDFVPSLSFNSTCLIFLDFKSV